MLPAEQSRHEITFMFPLGNWLDVIARASTVDRGNGVCCGEGRKQRGELSQGTAGQASVTTKPYNALCACP
jgi:hypothetical protein